MATRVPAECAPRSTAAAAPAAGLRSRPPRSSRRSTSAPPATCGRSRHLARTRRVAGACRVRRVACRRPRVGPLAAPRAWAGGPRVSGAAGGGMSLATAAGGDYALRAAVRATDMHTHAVVRNTSRGWPMPPRVPAGRALRSPTATASSAGLHSRSLMRSWRPWAAPQAACGRSRPGAPSPPAGGLFAARGGVGCRRPHVGPAAAQRVAGGGVLVSSHGGGGVPLATPAGGVLCVRAVVSVSECLRGTAPVANFGPEGG